MNRWTMAIVTSALVAGCGTDASPPQYAWDDRQVLCSMRVDDLVKSPSGLAWDDIDEQLRYAAEHRSVALLHAHVPGETISIANIERILDTARSRGLELVTFGELETMAAPRGAVALAFDDYRVDAWYAQRELLRAAGAHVTFFVTYYWNWTDEQRGQLAELARDGHDVQAHGLNHQNATEYVDAHGLQSYVTDEALPSIAILEQEGYAVTAYAFPFGSSNDALDAALLEHVRRVRVGVGSCPY